MVAETRSRVILVGLLLSLSACASPRPRPVSHPGPHPGPERQQRESLTEANWDRLPTGGVQSEVLVADAPFRELLVSWNVDPPPGGGFHVEVRAAIAKEGDAWSPWLCVGHWPANRTDTSGTSVEPTCVTAWADGRINVDVLVARASLRRTQLRVVPVGELGLQSGSVSALHPAERSRSLEVRRLDLCFTAADPGDPADATPRRSARLPRRGLRLSGFPRRSQFTERAELAPRICSPTSLAMVIEYFGVSVPTARVASLAYDPVHDIYGNWPRGIQAAWMLGVPGYVTRLEDWSAVEDLVGSGRPVVLSIRVGPGELRGAPYQKTSGHLLVVVGFDREGNVIVHDPAAPDERSVKRIYDRGELGRAWLDHGGTVYVLGPGPPVDAIFQEPRSSRPDTPRKPG